MLEENVYVRMRDSIRISLDINRPDGGEPVPALLSMSPYGKETQRFPGGPFSSVESGDTKYFVAHGYAHVLMDNRGSAPSEGQWALASADEQQDGYEVIEWLADQPWCNGKVAMVGGSYYGHIQFLVAATRPPHLATILPFNGWTDLYRDMVYHGGLLRGFFPTWIAGVMERVHPRLDEPTPEGWQGPADLLAEVMVRHRLDDAFYAERSVIARLDRITVPIYHLVSTASYNHYRSQLIAYTQLKAPQKLMILYGNLRRAMYSPPFSAEIVRWLDCPGGRRPTRAQERAESLRPRGRDAGRAVRRARAIPLSGRPDCGGGPASGRLPDLRGDRRPGRQQRRAVLGHRPGRLRRPHPPPERVAPEPDPRGRGRQPGSPPAHPRALPEPGPLDVNPGRMP